jgi:hypothetical protein
MRLRLLAEFNFGKLTRHVQPLLGVMPKRKRKHSLRVAKTIKRSGGSKAAAYAAALHDYLERGGDVETLTSHLDEFGLSPQALHAIQGLSSDEKYATNSRTNEPLDHVRQVLDSTSNQSLKDIIVLVKMADRLDNLRRRLRADGKIGRNYLNKSIALFDYLQTQYAGKPKPLRRLLLRFYDVLQRSSLNS